MAAFSSYAENQWIQAMDTKLISVHGKFNKTNSELGGFHSPFGKRIDRKRPIFWFFLVKLTSVEKAFQLEANQLREGILTRKYRGKMSKASVKRNALRKKWQRDVTQRTKFYKSSHT